MQNLPGLHSLSRAAWTLPGILLLASCAGVQTGETSVPEQPVPEESTVVSTVESTPRAEPDLGARPEVTTTITSGSSLDLAREEPSTREDQQEQSDAPPLATAPANRKMPRICERTPEETERQTVTEGGIRYTPTETCIGECTLFRAESPTPDGASATLVVRDAQGWTSDFAACHATNPGSRPSS